MTKKAAIQAAKELLKLHEGKCSVRTGTPFHTAFLTMEKAGLLILSEDSSGMVNVKEINAPTL